MHKIYLDNAATTPLRKEVIETMCNVLKENYGNPSSVHSFGRSAKAVVEQSRKEIASVLHCLPSEIIFTSSATEGINWILNNAVNHLGVTKIITTKIQHHATLDTVIHLQQTKNIIVEYVPVLPNGSLDNDALEKMIIATKEPTLVALLHVNNETGEIIAFDKIAQLCNKNEVLFFCDTVQSLGKKEINLTKNTVDFIVGTAHKCNGPKGVGFIFRRKQHTIQPLIIGGEQEKGSRAGTEAVHQIAGMARAITLAYSNLDKEQKHIASLKHYFVTELQRNFKNIKIIGKITIDSIVNIVLPFTNKQAANLLFLLDIKGIAVSRGSACQSGSTRTSHVLSEFLSEEEKLLPNIRVSFGYYNTKEEIAILLAVLQEIERTK